MIVHALLLVVLIDAKAPLCTFPHYFAKSIEFLSTSSKTQDDTLLIFLLSPR
jgi:hypothetical protein